MHVVLKWYLWIIGCQCWCLFWIYFVFVVAAGVCDFSQRLVETDQKFLYSHWMHTDPTHGGEIGMLIGIIWKTISDKTCHGGIIFVWPCATARDPLTQCQKTWLQMTDNVTNALQICTLIFLSLLVLAWSSSEPFWFIGHCYRCPIVDGPIHPR